ncbi:hypothetical protein PTH_0139 [Pelotomaculum thermopropionicum SI]|uniref:ATPase AAA-type core domain-containing protein n=1 Tax=Pelotomaculum thermopropionicum (strain DSM 13744 / JCM 10971 / SI) TaxID=370438 RepID=A5D623_PELTS|nr:hypothetical protein PTH_0139 [Pelotomaculum thermopropionicum SI]
MQRLWHQEWLTRKEKAGEVNNAQNLVHLEVIYKGDKEQFVNVLQHVFQGTGIRRDRLEKVARYYQDGIEILRALDARERFLSFGFTEKEWLKFYERAREQEKLLGLYRVPDTLEIKYGGQSISRLSLGQRASALLILLLSFENMPVIVDQPEDDLDSQTIYHGLIKELVKLKRKRQIIFATHNPNIPVLGDCEQVAVFSYGDSAFCRNRAIFMPRKCRWKKAVCWIWIWIFLKSFIRSAPVNPLIPWKSRLMSC